jgi:type VI secretion system protein ImpJ
MNAVHPLFWRQGLFLQPQHFQLADAHAAFRLAQATNLLQPWFWGVRELEFRDAALTSGRFEVTRLQALFPDGSLVLLPENALLAPRAFDPAAVTPERPLTVWLALKERRTGPNVTVVDALENVGDLPTRHAVAADPEEVEDLHAGGPAAQVMRLRFVLRLFLDGEEAEMAGSMALPIARLERTGDKVTASAAFIPPALTIGAHPALWKAVCDVRDLVAARAKQLEDYKPHGQTQGRDFDPGYVIFLQALMCLNRQLPLLTHLTETRDAHPWDMYGLLRQFVGELSTFTEEIGALGERNDGARLLPAYDHLDLSACFLSARTLIQQMVDGIGASIELMVRLEPSGNRFSAELPQRVFEGRNRYWLVIRAEDADLETVAAEVLRLVKLCATPVLTTLLVKAVSGLPLTRHPLPPAGLPKRAGTLYFQIEHESPLWQDVVRARGISLFWDSPPPGMTAHVAVVRGQ